MLFVLYIYIYIYIYYIYILYYIILYYIILYYIILYYIIYRSLSFRVQIGSTSSSGSACETADYGEDVIVEYQPQGSALFAFLLTLGYDSIRLLTTTVAMVIPFTCYFGLL